MADHEAMRVAASVIDPLRLPLDPVAEGHRLLLDPATAELEIIVVGTGLHRTELARLRRRAHARLPVARAATRAHRPKRAITPPTRPSEGDHPRPTSRASQTTSATKRS